MRLDNYTKKVKAFETDMLKVKNISLELSMQNAADNAEKILSRVGVEKFHLVIVGEFSRGKSTFVNALLGKKILPASKKPTTAIISKIIYGDKPEYKIFRKGNSRPKILTEEEFVRVTAPKEPDESDPQSIREYVLQQKAIDEIDFAEIKYPLELCCDNVEVVDTPGTNDLNVGRMEITYGYLNKADACILLLSATQPLSRSEAEFLKERIIGNKIQDIFFVISGKDKLHDREEEKRVLDFVELHLMQVLPKNFMLHNKIFLVSSRAALIYRRKQGGEILKPKLAAELPANFDETGFSEFEETLGYFLANEKGMIKLRHYVENAKNLITMIRHDLAVNIGIVAHSADDIRQKVVIMEGKFKDAKSRAEKIIRDMRFNFQSVGGDIDTKCKSAAQSIIIRAKAAVNNLDKDMSDREMKNQIERAVTDEKKTFIDSTMQKWQKIFDSERDKTSQALRAIWSDIDLQYQREFNLPALMDSNSLSIEISVDRSESFYDKASKYVGRAFDRGTSFFGMLGNLFAGAVSAVAGFVSDVFSGDSSSKKDWREEIRETVEKTYRSLDKDMANTLKKQFDSNAKNMCDNFQRGVNARINDMERQLKDILREKESMEQDASRKKNYLLQRQNELSQIEKNLNSLV